MSGRFELYRDVRERYRFRLKSDDGEIILTSDGFDRKAFALDAIVSVMKSASEAVIIDLTLRDTREYDREEDLFFDEDESYDFDEADYGLSRNKKGRKKKNKTKGRRSDNGNKPDKGKKAKKRKKKRKGKK